MTETRKKRISRTVAPKRVIETEAMRQERIATRAYERFVARGQAHGGDVDDWLAAEAELQRP